MTYGIRNKATGAWVENCEFGTRAEAEAHLRAQFHREWIEDHHIEERSGTMGVDRWHESEWKLRERGITATAEINALTARVAAMEEALRKIASTADMSKYRPNELERCCLPDSAVDSDGFADMPTDMKRGLDYNAKIAHAALAKSALEGGGCNGK